MLQEMVKETVQRLRKVAAHSAVRALNRHRCPGSSIRVREREGEPWKCVGRRFGVRTEVTSEELTAHRTTSLVCRWNSGKRNIVSGV